MSEVSVSATGLYVTAKPAELLALLRALSLRHRKLADAIRSLREARH